MKARKIPKFLSLVGDICTIWEKVLYIGTGDDIITNILKAKKFRAMTSAVREEGSSIVADAFFIGSFSPKEEEVTDIMAAKLEAGCSARCARNVLTGGI